MRPFGRASRSRPSVLATGWDNRPGASTGPAAPIDDADSIDLGAALGAPELSQLLRVGDVAECGDCGRGGPHSPGARACSVSPAARCCRPSPPRRASPAPGPEPAAGRSTSATRSAAASTSRSTSICSALAGPSAAPHAPALARPNSIATRPSLLIRTEIARAYVQRAVIAARIELLDRNIARAADLERIIRLRVEAGEDTRSTWASRPFSCASSQTESHRLHEALDRRAPRWRCWSARKRRASARRLLRWRSSPCRGLAASLPPAAIVERPDIRAAEARIRAAGGDVDAARAAFFPRLQTQRARARTGGESGGRRWPAPSQLARTCSRRSLIAADCAAISKSRQARRRRAWRSIAAPC